MDQNEQIWSNISGSLEAWKRHLNINVLGFGLPFVYHNCLPLII